MDRDDAFRQFVAVRGATLMRVAYVLTGDSYFAEDLLQIALTKVAGRWWRIRSPEKAEAYARTALYREYVNWRRVKRNSEAPTEVLPEPAESEDFAAEAVQRMTIGRALAELTRRQRAVLILRFYEDRSVEQTAELLGCSTGTVKSQTSVALAHLRRLGPELAHLLSDIEADVPVGGGS